MRRSSEHWHDELAAAEKQHLRREQELERATRDQMRLSAERDAIRCNAGVVSDQEAATIRAARELPGQVIAASSMWRPPMHLKRCCVRTIS